MDTELIYAMVLILSPVYVTGCLYLLDKLLNHILEFIKDVKDFRRYKKVRDYYLDYEVSPEEFLNGIW